MCEIVDEGDAFTRQFIKDLKELEDILNKKEENGFSNSKP